MPAKDNNLIVQAPTQGISSSPHNGYADCRNTDIHTIPGVAILNKLLEKKSSTTVVTLVQWFVKNPATPTECYALDSSGKVYKSADSGGSWALMTGNTQTSCNGNGLAIFKNYLIVARDAFLDVCGDGSATGITNANWTNGWKAIDSDILWHPMIISDNDSKLYGGAGRYVFSLDELTTFAPATPATFTFTQQALDLPATVRIKALAELGSNLMCGTWKGTNYYDNRFANIYSWDRSSPSFGQPVQISENGVHAMINIGGLLYVMAGIEGKIFICDGVGYSLIGQIPATVANLDGGSYLLPFPGALINFKQRPFFGISYGNANLGSMGVWSVLRTASGNVLNFEYTISENVDGSSAPVQIGALIPFTQDVLLVGWRNNATYGIDKLNNASFATGYTSFFDTPLYKVGYPLQKRTFTELEFQLAKPLATNQGIRFAYRTNLTDSFTIIGTYDFATLGAVISFNTIANIPPCEFLQIRISQTGTTTPPHYKYFTLK